MYDIGDTMIYFLFFISISACYLLYRYKKLLDSKGDTTGVIYVSVTNAFEVVLSLTAVTVLYAVLSYSLSDMASDEVTMSVLRNYEKKIHDISAWLSYVRLSPLQSFIVLILWICIT